MNKILTMLALSLTGASCCIAMGEKKPYEPYVRPAVKEEKEKQSYTPYTPSSNQETAKKITIQEIRELAEISKILDKPNLKKNVAQSSLQRLRERELEQNCPRLCTDADLIESYKKRFDGTANTIALALFERIQQYADELPKPKK